MAECALTGSHRLGGLLRKIGEPSEPGRCGNSQPSDQISGYFGRSEQVERPQGTPVVEPFEQQRTIIWTCLEQTYRALATPCC